MHDLRVATGSPLVRALAAGAVVLTVASCRDRPSSSSPPAEASPQLAASPSLPSPSPRPDFRPFAVSNARDAAPGFVEQQLAMRAAEGEGNLRPVGAPIRGVLGEGGRARHPFDVSAGHCYRVLGASGVEAEQLDLALYAPDGTEIDADTRGDEAPVLGATRPLCPPVSGTYTVEAHMVRGQGDYGLQVMATP